MRKVLFVLLCIVFFIVAFNSCHSMNLQKYYSQKDNYVSASGTVTYIKYDEDGSALYLEFTDLNPSFDDSCFKIVGENLTIVQNNELDKQIKVGDTIEFVSAPKYFGDGYVMPIVSISKNKVVFLEFEKGFENFCEWLDDNY